MPVVRHAWRSWLLETGHLFATLVILTAGLAIDGLLAVMIICCAVMLCLLLRKIAQEFPEVFRRHVEETSTRWGFRVDAKRRRLSEPNLKSRKRLLKAMLACCLIAALCPLAVSLLLQAPLASAARQATVISFVLVFCAIVAGVVRQRLLSAVAHSETLRPVTLTRREKIIGEQQDYTCVVYHRPPHRSDDADPLDLLARPERPSPFVGSGRLVNRWLPPLTVQLLKPGDGSLTEREYTKPPFHAHKLVEALRTKLTELGSDPGAENLPGLTVLDRIYIAAADFPANADLLRRSWGKLEIWKIIDDHRHAGHHFLEISVPIFGGELVATVLLRNAVKLGREVDLHARHHRSSQSQETILESLNLAALVLLRVSVKGRCLSLDVATCALTRTPEKYHVIDWSGERGTGALLHSAARCALAVPEDLRRLWRLLEIPLVLGRAWWAQKDRTAVIRHKSTGLNVAVREEIADVWENAQLDRTTIYDHMKIVEQRILKTTKDFLTDYGVDTSVFEKQATNIINSGVLNMGGGQMTVEQMAAGMSARIINNGLGNSESEGVSA
ncbi:MAG: hypothetical protein ACRDQU_16140 [Pseudonocardiaceae bacterium]